MKVIFLFFAALNLVFFIWQSLLSGGPTNSERATRIPAGVTKLQLLHEPKPGKVSAQDQKTAKAGNQPKTPPSKPVKQASLSPNAEICYSLGPFEASQQAKPIAEKLRDLGALTAIDQQKNRVPSGFWVYIPKFDSWTEARKKVMELESQGMKDIFIMGRGRMKNAVSLGLFKNKIAADKRIKKLQKMGIEPEVETQYSLSEQYWINIDIEFGKKKVVKSIQTIAKGLTVLELLDRDCN